MSAKDRAVRHGRRDPRHAGATERSQALAWLAAAEAWLEWEDAASLKRAREALAYASERIDAAIAAKESAHGEGQRSGASAHGAAAEDAATVTRA